MKIPVEIPGKIHDEMVECPEKFLEVSWRIPSKIFLDEPLQELRKKTTKPILENEKTAI